jgi:NADPH:quinone reductase-like Zn-dependent oxidoreductase
MAFEDCTRRLEWTPVPDDARAFWVAAPGRGEIRTEPVGPPASGEVLMRALFSGISRGTESLVFRGRVPPSEFERMRAPFQSGHFPAPVKYGYASVGEVEEGPSDLKGRLGFTLYPHQTRYVVPATAIHLLPVGTPPSRAVLAANLETAINGVWDARPLVGDRVSVIGAGAVGCMTAWLLSRIPGCEVELVDSNPSRASVAQALGVRFALPERATGEADVVIHASGAPEGLALALQVAAFEATVVELSWYGDQDVPLALGRAFHARRLTITSSQVGSVAAAQRARWDTRRRMQLALRLLESPTLDVLITGESDFDTLPDVMDRLSTSSADTICHRVKYEQA